MKTQIAELLNQEMDRKEFLRYAGIAVLMLLGAGMIMQALGVVGGKHQGKSSSYGYGASAYGGKSLR